MSNFLLRKEILSRIEAKRKRNVVAFITSHKKPEGLFATQIAQDTLPIFYEILSQDKYSGKLDLVLNSSGGQIDTPWPLVNLLREYFDEISVIVPWKAHSAATLIALGANCIEMGPLASLSPIDPQFTVKTSPKEGVAGSVEDVYGYYSLITKTLELDSAGKAEALKLLASRISPEMLGKISRTRAEIRIIAKNLLELHLKDKVKIKKIVDKLVEDLPSHEYFINRKEARQMGLPIKYLGQEEEHIFFDLINSYRAEAQMDEPGLLIKFEGEETKKDFELSRAFIETKETSYAFISQFSLQVDGKIERKGDQWKKVA